MNGKNITYIKALSLVNKAKNHKVVTKSMFLKISIRFFRISGCNISLKQKFILLSWLRCFNVFPRIYLGMLNLLYRVTETLKM